MKKIVLFPTKIWGFVKEVVQEIKLVEFPSRSETSRMTGIVLATMIALGILLLILDTVFIFLRNYITNINS
ncbi:MAG: preprotein translocase subunit SecE [Candidatus Dojkabacteria bacterium]